MVRKWNSGSARVSWNRGKDTMNWTKQPNGSFIAQVGDETAIVYKPRGHKRWWLSVQNAAGVEVLSGVSPFDHSSPDGRPQAWGAGSDTKPRAGATQNQQGKHTPLINNQLIGKRKSIPDKGLRLD